MKEFIAKIRTYDKRTVEVTVKAPHYYAAYAEADKIVEHDKNKGYAYVFAVTPKKEAA